LGVTPGQGSDLDLSPIGPMLARTWGQSEVTVLRVERLSAGASRLSWAVDVRAEDGDHALIVQRERVAGQGRSEVETESRLLRAAARHGVPVPAVIAADPTGVVLGGAFLVTARVAGETLPRRILRDPQLSSARAGFARQCGHILADIHAIPIDQVAPLAEPDPLEAIETMLDAAHDPRPAFEIGLRHLRATRPRTERRSLVHGDFRNGNLILAADGVRAVLDWELAHIGDPIEDLGWLCARAWRWGGPDPVGGMGSVEDLVSSYREVSGFCFDLTDFRWWQLLATVKWGAICLEQARTHLSGEARSVELAVLGRLAAEVEYDVLRMVKADE
jgi:aminoglycoside phosphotransferase (APT) family kinase protein